VSEHPEAGLIGSLQRMLATLVALVQTRLEHAAGVLLWSIAAIFFASLTVLLLALTVLIAFWDEHRLLAAGLVTGSFAGLALAAVLVVRHRLRHRPKFLAATVGELRRDADALGAERP